jgi:hypothetical protein
LEKQMSAGSGRVSCESFATYDPDSCSWRTSQPSLFEDLQASPPTWPKSGTWDLGAAYERPTLALAIDGNASSSSLGLLPTPAAGNFNDGESLESWEERRQRNLAKGINGNGQGTPLAIAAQQLLKTPTAQLSVNGGSQHPDKRRGGGHGPTLADQVECELLPTPSVADVTGGHRYRSGDRRSELLLPGVAEALTSPGGHSSSPSGVTSAPSAAPLRGQLSLDELESA